MLTKQRIYVHLAPVQGARLKKVAVGYPCHERQLSYPYEPSLHEGSRRDCPVNGDGRIVSS